MNRQDALRFTFEIVLTCAMFVLIMTILPKPSLISENRSLHVMMALGGFVGLGAMVAAIGLWELAGKWK